MVGADRKLCVPVSPFSFARQGKNRGKKMPAYQHLVC